MAIKLDKIAQKVRTAPRPATPAAGPTLSDFNAALSKVDDLNRQLDEERRLRITAATDLARAEAELASLRQQNNQPRPDQITLTTTEHSELLSKIDEMTRKYEQAASRVEEIERQLVEQLARPTDDAKKDPATPSEQEAPDGQPTYDELRTEVEKLKAAASVVVPNSPEKTRTPEEQASIEKHLDAFLDLYTTALRIMTHRSVPASIKRELATLTRGMATSLGELEQLLTPSTPTNTNE